MAKEKKMAPGADISLLKQDFLSGNFGRCYLFYGTETYLRDFYLTKLRDALIQPDFATFNYHVLSAKEYSFLALRELTETLPFLGERTMIVVSDVDILKESADTEKAAGSGKKKTAKQGNLLDFILDLPEYVCVVFLYDVISARVDKRTKIVQAINKVGHVVNFEAPQTDELTRWVDKHMKVLHHSCSRENIEYLIFRCGADMTNLLSETEKLCFYARKTEITREDIDAVTIPNAEAVVFDLTDAISAGDYDRALTELGKLLQMQEAVQKLTAILGRQFRQLYTAKLSLECGKETAWLAGLWNFSNSYPAVKLRSSAEHLSMDWCCFALRGVEKLDCDLKTDTGAGDSELLTDFILRLAAHQKTSGGAI